MARSPIPADVADAFGEALVLLVQWEGGADEPVAILDGRSTNITMIFELVAGRAFRDEVPRSMLELLRTYAARDPERQKEIAVLALRPTYEIAARCLLIDTSTAAGKCFLDMLGVFAEFETNLRRERQLEGIAKAKAAGVYKGRPPSIEASRVRELKAQGMRPVDIAKTLKIGRASVYRVLGTSAD